MADRSELVILVSGLSASSSGSYIDKLCGGIRDYFSANNLSFRQVEQPSGLETSNRKQFCLTETDGSTRTIDVQEISWSELIPPLFNQKNTTQLLSGLMLVYYWLSAKKVWKVAKHSRYMLMSMLFAACVMVLWYIGLFLAVGTSLGATTDSPQSMFNLPEFAKPLLQEISTRAKALGSWHLFGFALALSALAPTKTIVNHSYSAQSYLTNRDNVFYKIRSRLFSAFHEASKHQHYQQITVVGYSFGSIPAIEALAAYHGAQQIRFISLGSPRMLMAARAERLEKATKQLILNPQVVHWYDYYSKYDFLCSKPLQHQDATQYSSFELNQAVPYTERLNGKSHEAYFYDWEVIARITECLEFQKDDHSVDAPQIGGVMSMSVLHQNASARS